MKIHKYQLKETESSFAAVQIMKSKLAMSSEEIEEKSGEVGKVRSEHLVNIYEWSETLLSYQFISDFLRGGRLLKEVERRKEQRQSFEAGEVIQLAKQLLAAVCILHTKQLYLGRINPRNVLLLRQCSV